MKMRRNLTGTIDRTGTKPPKRRSGGRGKMYWLSHVSDPTTSIWEPTEDFDHIRDVRFSLIQGGLINHEDNLNIISNSSPKKIVTDLKEGLEYLEYLEYIFNRTLLDNVILPDDLHALPKATKTQIFDDTRRLDASFRQYKANKKALWNKMRREVDALAAQNEFEPNEFEPNDTFGQRLKRPRVIVEKEGSSFFIFVEKEDGLPTRVADSVPFQRKRGFWNSQTQRYVDAPDFTAKKLKADPFMVVFYLNQTGISIDPDNVEIILKF